jgi:hypothetical protein
MSRSYRKPYATCTGKRSASYDKTVAARCVRRANKSAIRTASDWEEFTPVDRYECAHNDVWGWDRDGKASLEFSPRRNDTWASRWLNLFGEQSAEERFQERVKYYNYLKRK